MFGFVMAEAEGLSAEEKIRYGQVYCGICRQLRLRASQSARMVLSYDMAFLALLLMSLYEPEETQGKRACLLHPLKPRPWTDNPYVRYAADMNIALGYYNAQDDWEDDRRLRGALGTAVLKKDLRRIRQDYPRQCKAIEECLERLHQLEAESCPEPDLPAGCFGQLMGELMVYREDLWADTLRKLGHALGRFIYLADGAVDYRQDEKKGSYNPYIAMGTGENRQRWEEYLTMAMGRCTDYYERLPLVQDKGILDNILYSGVWVQYRMKLKAGKDNDR